MLTQLFIQNLVLIDSCKLSFSSNFTVITGETGAGKSALLTALGLVLGDRADNSLIRRGESTASVEAHFDKNCASIPEEIAQPTTVLKRELLSSGKSRAYINGFLVPLSLLKQVGSALIEISDQHSSLALKQPSCAQQILDQFAQTDTLRNSFSIQYKHLYQLNEQLSCLLREEPLRQPAIEQLEKELQNIEASQILEIDDTELFNRFSELEKEKIEHEKSQQMLATLEQTFPALSSLRKTSLNHTIEPHIVIACTQLQEALNELRYSDSTQLNLEKELCDLEQKLSQIDKLQKKYGTSKEQVSQAYTSMQRRLKELYGRDQEIEALEQSITLCAQECDSLSKELTCKRTAAASRFSQHIQKMLPDLNMQGARFSVAIANTRRTETGSDAIEFMFEPNVGEKQLLLREYASGGEMARLFLAICTLLAEKQSVDTVVFDEVDASIGGMTANAIGEIFSSMGRSRQVIAITHFVQVASKADAHFALKKRTEHNRTISYIHELNNSHDKQQEHLRMVGTNSTT